MKGIIISILLVCATLHSVAQTNFVKNGDFEQYSNCPNNWDQLTYAKYWHPTFDSTYPYPGEYNNVCANIDWDHICHIPENTAFYQYPHSGGGLIALVLYYDKTLPPPPSVGSFNFRDYAQVRLYKNLTVGKNYCISFWVVKTESYCYAHNKIGAYLDDGSINSAVDSAGKEITSVVPQVYTNTIIKDTMNWTKIEGTFVAKGTESMITIGNFFPNSALDTTSEDCTPGGLPQYSYYLIDDVSVVAIDAKANAGVDRWVELSKSTQIGPVEDSTARGMDCKWYHKGKLIDSGNVISVNASTIKYAVDTYIVVQNVCGNITRDTMLLRTVGMGMEAPLSLGEGQGVKYSLFPNPNDGNFVIKQLVAEDKIVGIKIYDALGRLISKHQLHFVNGKVSLELPQAFPGQYVIYIDDRKESTTRIKFTVK